MNQIKTFEEACAVKGIDPAQLTITSAPTKHVRSTMAFAQLCIIAEVLNDGWVPDWNDNDEYKYYPWIDLEKSEDNPSGFSLNSVFYDFSFSNVPSRLCFKTEELAEYAFNTFEQLYKDYFLIE